VEFGKKGDHISDLIPRPLDRASPSEWKDLETNPCCDKIWPVGISDLLHLTFACHEGRCHDIEKSASERGAIDGIAQRKREDKADPSSSELHRQRVMSTMFPHALSSQPTSRVASRDLILPCTIAGRYHGGNGHAGVILGLRNAGQSVSGVR
jgi:hypothetical protein